MGFATVYAFRHRLCENTLQQVDGLAATKRHTRRGSRRRSGKDKEKDRGKTDPQLTPGSAEDARLLRNMLSMPAKGITVLCVDPPASYTGEAFLRTALSGRAATVHIRAGEGDGTLVACLARGLGVQFVTVKLQLSSVLPGFGVADGKGGSASGQRGQGEKLADLG
ncbi:unnamed protein product, partial [Sphacelaria rigidula]